MTTHNVCSHSIIGWELMYTHYVIVRWETNLWGEGKHTHTHKVRVVCIYSGSRFLGSKFNGSAVSPCECVQDCARQAVWAARIQCTHVGLSLHIVFSVFCCHGRGVAQGSVKSKTSTGHQSVFREGRLAYWCNNIVCVCVCVCVCMNLSVVRVLGVGVCSGS